MVLFLVVKRPSCFLDWQISHPLRLYHRGLFSNAGDLILILFLPGRGFFAAQFFGLLVEQPLEFEVLRVVGASAHVKGEREHLKRVPINRFVIVAHVIKQRKLVG